MKSALIIVTVGGLAATTHLMSFSPTNANSMTQTALNSEVDHPAGMNLMRWRDGSFYEDSVAQIQALSAAHGQERQLVFLDIAELDLAHALTRESQSILSSVNPTELSPGQRGRWQDLSDAVRLLDGKPVENPELSTLTAAYRKDRDFWAAMIAIASEDAESLFENLPRVLAATDQVPPKIVRLALPVLIEAMIEADYFTQAQEGLDRLVRFPEFAEALSTAYLQGRLAQKQNKQKTAFDHYFVAAKGWDKYAARARLRLTDMAIANGGKGALLAASEILERGINAWRGDYLELASLKQLAIINTLTHNTFAALMTNNKIMWRFPGSESAEQAAAQAKLDLHTLYQSGAKGELSLKEWHSMHLRLNQAYRQFPSFTQNTETFADSVLKMGATELAIEEYDRILDLLADQQADVDIQLPKDQFIRLQLKKIQALTIGGRYSDARKALERTQDPTGRDLMDLKGELTALVMSYLADPTKTLAAATGEPSAVFLRRIAFASWKTGLWGDSIKTYRRLWMQYPNEFAVDDASYLLIAAHKTGDLATANAVVEKFPDLTESADMAAFAQRLLEIPADIFPLTKDRATERITSADDTVQQLDANGL